MFADNKNVAGVANSKGTRATTESWLVCMATRLHALFFNAGKGKVTNRGTKSAGQVGRASTVPWKSHNPENNFILRSHWVNSPTQTQFKVAAEQLGRCKEGF